MARIRTIKPSFWTSSTTARLSREARLLAVGLISMADDDGRFLASTNAISGYVYPNDDIPPTKVRRWFAELVKVGMVHEYQRDSITYGCFPEWHRHQVINRYTPSSFPAPDIECSPRKSGGKS